MTNNRRRAERRREIQKLRIAGELARQQGKPRSSAPFKAYESTNHVHWLNGWDEEDDRLRRESVETASEAHNAEHDRLLAAISLYEHTPSPQLLAAILRAMALRLPSHDAASMIDF